MSNPSTIWATLSIPNPAGGSVPFVATDNASIISDVVNFFYTQSGASLSGSLQNYQLTAFGGFRQAYQDSTSTPGSVTVTTGAGRGKIAPAASSITITSPYAFANSIISVVLEGVKDATLTSVTVTPALGSFTITGNAAATTAVVFSWIINNVYAPGGT